MEQIFLDNKNNYGFYSEFVDGQPLVVHTANLDHNTINKHFNSITNILRDGIETEEVQNLFINIFFTDNENVELNIMDYFFNLIFWELPASLDHPIDSSYLFYEKAISKRAIKPYIDRFIYENIEKYQFNLLNCIISDMLEKFSVIDDFSMYLCNTINLEDTIDLMNKYPEFEQSMHLDLTGVAIEDIKTEGMNVAQMQIDYIKNSGHCLRDNFMVGEGINPKQFKEVHTHIGSKPDGHGGIFPSVINTSYLNGGLYDAEALFIDSSVSRVAQILSKINVADSGHFARLIGINNMDTIFYPNKDYVCDTKNFLTETIDDNELLSLYDGRYYKEKENGPDKLLNARRDKHLVGRTLLFRSPITCASFARGEGICPRCYGRLYHVNKDINPGKIAAELLSAKLTQRQLSAKHILESAVIKLLWTEGFNELFEVNFNAITLIQDFDYTGYKLIINQNNIFLEDEMEEVDYNEYITSFDIMYPDGKIRTFSTSELDSIYISQILNEKIRFASVPLEDNITLDLNILTDIDVLFLMHIKNNELSKTLEASKAIINKEAVTSRFDKDSIVKEFITTCSRGGINIQAIHAEVIIANQIRAVGDELEDILEKPDWTIKDVPYRILTLNSSLNNNASITVTLQYQKVGKTLYAPLSFKKHKSSFLDLYFMPRPQQFLSNKDIIDNDIKYREDSEINKSDGIKFITPDDNELDDVNNPYSSFMN